MSAGILCFRSEERYLLSLELCRLCLLKSGRHFSRNNDLNVVSWRCVTQHSCLLLTGSGSFWTGKVESLH